MGVQVCQQRIHPCTPHTRNSTGDVDGVDEPRNLYQFDTEYNAVPQWGKRQVGSKDLPAPNANTLDLEHRHQGSLDGSLLPFQPGDDVAQSAGNLGSR